MPLLARLALAALAGTAAGFSFEPLRFIVLLPFAVAGFTLLCRAITLGRGFLVGTVFGTAFMLTLLPWLQVIGVDAWLMLSLLEGLFYGLLGFATAAVMRLPWWPMWAAALWVGVETFRGTVPFGGFPWGRLAFATVDTPVANLFAYVGTAGATFAVALVSTVLAWTVLAVRRTPARATATLALTCLVASLGAFLQPGQAASREGSATVAAVQGNVPGEGMHAFAERRAVLNNHVSATLDYAREIRAGATPRPDLVIWPENSTDIDPFADPTVFADIQAAVDAVGAPVLVGAMVSGPEADEVRNQGIVWNPGGGPAERYSKTHPVPFGEYIPFRDLVAKYFTRLDQIPRDMVPGTEPGLLDIAGLRIGDVICFEVAYDDLVREVVTGGARMLVVQTNNATYISTGQIEQQFAISRLRAIETGRHVVVAATNGVSGIVSPTGRVIESATPRTQKVLVEDIELATGLTPGIRWGGLVELALTVLAAVSVLAGVVSGYRRRRRVEPQRLREPVAARMGDE